MQISFKKIKRLIFAIFLAEAAGIIGSFATMPNISAWYIFLQKPWFTPPSWLFAPVWTLLFLLMGIASYLVYEKGIRRSAVRKALLFYGIQLVVNILWSFSFFGVRNPLLGLITIIILWFLIIWTFIRFYPISKLAAYLLVPYFLWVSFAVILNGAIVVLN